MPQGGHTIGMEMPPQIRSGPKRKRNSKSGRDAAQAKKKTKKTMTKVKTWYRKQKILLFEKAGEKYKDVNLEKCLEVEDLLQGIKDVECKF